MLDTGPSTRAASPARDKRRFAFLRQFFRSLMQNKLALAGFIYLVILIGLMVAQPFLPIPSPTRINVMNSFASPSTDHLLGTDENGRDVFARLIVGGRISLIVGLSSAVLTALIGAIFGVMAGYAGGVVDSILMRFTDGLLSVPIFFLLLTVVAIFGSTPTVLVVSLALTRWMGVARLVRAEVLRLKEQDFVAAIRGLGASNVRIMIQHLLPQAAPSLIVATSIGVGSVMLIEAGISFLGLGITPPTPSWGNMLTSSQFYMWSAPQLAVYPGLLILLTVLAFNALGDVLRDALDPRHLSR